MGEAKRRLQKLGSMYFKVPGLTVEKKRHLIAENINELISNHLTNCGYDDYIYSPPDYYYFDLEKAIDLAINDWQNTYTQNYDQTFLELLVLGILKKHPILLKNEMIPVEPLPEARKYFRKLILSKKVNLKHHYILIKDVLIVLGQVRNLPLLRQLYRQEFDSAIEYAESEKLSWLEINSDSNNKISLSSYTQYQGLNLALAGILTIVATLPWQFELSRLMVEANRT